MKRLTEWLKQKRINRLKVYLAGALARQASDVEMSRRTGYYWPVSAELHAGRIAELKETLRQLGETV